jgi:hypothetical protein
MNLLRIAPARNRALLREARVTLARRQTACGRGIAALAALLGYEKPTASAVGFFFDLALFCFNIVDMLEQYILDIICHGTMLPCSKHADFVEYFVG